MTAAEKPASGYIAKVYGRRQDKPLKPRQERLMQALLPRVISYCKKGHRRFTLIPVTSPTAMRSEK